jgi:hypothetical protein
MRQNIDIFPLEAKMSSVKRRKVTEESSSKIAKPKKVQKSESPEPSDESSSEPAVSNAVPAAEGDKEEDVTPKSFKDLVRLSRPYDTDYIY